jgi:hypothetical protein
VHWVMNTYLDCVKGRIMAGEVHPHEVHPKTRGEHSDAADQEDADDSIWNGSANGFGTRTGKPLTFLPTVYVQVHGGMDRQDENEQVREDIDGGHGVVHRRDIIAVWRMPWE